ncbi:hemolysin family protein [Candidatus Synechococcus spongiarum]|uniref:hemolysin family protein n=1 Tax=Candidatus Synechococcus spongiarum TaxID=431041 RepID=UPI0004B2A756|nr:hemolysin family protein [Candidatus Synechococcus spongiarum]
MALAAPLLFIPLLMAVLAFCLAGELALLRLRPTQVQELTPINPSAAATVERLQRRPLRALILTQFGSCFALLAMGWLAGWLAQDLLPLHLQSSWLTVVLLCVTTLLVALGASLLPKAMVLHQPERAALALGPQLQVAITLLDSPLRVLERCSLSLLTLFRLPHNWQDLAPPLSAGELETLIETDNVTGLQPDERLILEGAFSLRDTLVREVMIPRSQMVTLPADVTFRQLMAAVQNTRHARFPVLGQSLDDVKGLLDLRSLAGPLGQGKIRGDTPMRPYLAPLQRIAETASLAELLALIRDDTPMLLVVDTHGGTEGLVTIADLTGEIVGEEEDAANGQPVAVRTMAPGHWCVAADLEIDEINRQLNISLPQSEKHHTLAGFLLEQFQRIPAVGESLHWHELHFVVQRLKGPRITHVELRMPPGNPGHSGRSPRSDASGGP